MDSLGRITGSAAILRSDLTIIVNSNDPWYCIAIKYIKSLIIMARYQLTTQVVEEKNRKS